MKQHDELPARHVYGEINIGNNVLKIKFAWYYV